MSRIALGLDVVVVAFFGAAYLLAQEFSGEARWFPIAVVVPGVLLAVANLLVDVFKVWRPSPVPPAPEEPSDAGEEPAGQPVPSFVVAGGWLLWIVAYGVVILLVGVFVGTTLWMIAFFLVGTRAGWRFTLLSVAATLLLMVFYGDVMGLTWPDPLLHVPFAG